MGRSTKPAVRRGASFRADSAAPFVILAVVALLGFAGFMNQRQGGAAIAVWTEVGVRALTYFAIITPLVILGVFALSKIFKFQLTGGTYIRAAAIAALPMIAILGAPLVSPSTGLQTLLLIASFPLAALFARGLFGLNLIETLAAAGICVPLLLVGIALSSKLTTLAHGSSGDIAQLAKNVVETGTVSPGTSTPRPTGRASGAPDAMQVRLDDLQYRVDGISGDAMARMTREQFNELLRSMQDELQALKVSKGTTPQWERLSMHIRDLAAQALNLPSEKPDDSLYQPMAATQNWSNISLDARGGGDISFDAFNFRAPPTAKLDLRSSNPDAPVLAWSWPNSWTTLTLKLISAPDARQKRPWLVNRAMLDRLMPAPKFHVIEADPSAMTAGNLADTVFFRIDRSASPYADILYTGLVDGKWIIATISSASPSEASTAFEAAIKTLRNRPEAEAKVDAFAPALMVKRLEDEPATASALLRKQGAASEDALLSAIREGDPRMQARALAVLADVGTTKSIEPIKPLLDSSDKTVSQAALAMLKRVAPSDYDDLAMAAMSLKRGTDAERSASLRMLAAATKDPRRAQITRELDAFMLTENRALYNDSVKALAVWADAQTASLLIPWLGENESAQRRNAAFAILPTTRDPLTVLPLLKWVIREPDKVVKAVAAVGPSAEDEVIRQLFTNLDNNRNVVARKAGAQILQEIGTSKSLPVLQRASNDPRDATAAQIAKVAYDTVRQRVQPGRGGPTTAPRGRG